MCKEHICICEYVYICVCVNACMYVQGACKCVHVCVCMHLCAHVCVCVCHIITFVFRSETLMLFLRYLPFLLETKTFIVLGFDQVVLARQSVSFREPPVSTSHHALL